MGLKTLELDVVKNVYNLGLEKEQLFDDFLKSKSMLGRWKWRAIEFLVNRIGYMPYASFQREDVDDAVVMKLIKYPKHLNAVIRWVEEIDHDVLPLFREAKVIFEKIQKPKRRDHLLYRGFKIKGDQYNLGLGRLNLRDLNVGDKFSFDVDKLLSFSSFKEVTKAYGNVAVTVDYDKEDHRMFHITNEVIVAAFMVAENTTSIDEAVQAEQTFTYFESVFLPDGKPLEFTLLQK